LDLGRTGFAGRRHYERCHRLQRQVLARTRRPLLGVFRRSCDSSDIGLLIEERVVITKVRTIHLSVKIHLPKTKLPLLLSTQTVWTKRKWAASRDACHVSIM